MIDLTFNIIANKNDTVNIKVTIFDIFVKMYKNEVNILDTLNKIKQLLKANNLNQKALTDYLGISKNAFTNWSNGSNKSYIKHLPQIAEFFNVSIDYLVGRTSKQEDLEENYHKERLTDGKNTLNNDNDFTYAAYNELTHNLTPHQIEQLKNFADFLRQQN